jgi:hypothetical protein
MNPFCRDNEHFLVNHGMVVINHLPDPPGLAPAHFLLFPKTKTALKKYITV